MSQKSYKDLKAAYYRQVRPALIPLNQGPENCGFRILKRRLAIVRLGEPSIGMYLPSNLGNVMAYRVPVRSENDIVVLLTQIFHKCQTISSTTEAALRSDKFEKEKEIIRILGWSLWTLISSRLWEHKMIKGKTKECFYDDDEHEMVRIKDNVMSNIFRSVCRDLHETGKKITCYSVFAGFLESLNLGEWKGEIFQTNVVIVREYEGSTSEEIIIDDVTKPNFANGCEPYWGPNRHVR